MHALSIDLAEFRSLWEARWSHAVALLDVRERWEFADGHIPGASPLPRGRLETCASLVLPDPACPVIVCSDGETRSALAVSTLRAMGYSRARGLRGGLAGWRSAGLAVTTGWGVSGKKIGEEVAHAIPDLQVPASRAAGWIDDGRTLVIDIRPRWEYEQGHLPGAVHAPAGELPALAPGIRALVASGSLDHVVTHCAGRTRGIAAAQLLRSLGVRTAYALENGCMGWLLDGRELAYGAGAHARGRLMPTDVNWPETDLAGVSVNWISPGELVRRRDGGACYVVDLRTPEAHREGHVPGSLALPAGQVLLESEAWLACAALPVVLVGSTRAQSMWAASQLQALGYRDVCAVDGGMGAWLEAGQPLSKGLPPPRWPRGIGDVATQEVPAETYCAEPDRWHVVDVRSAGEWGIAHLAGSRCVPRGVLEREAAALRQSPKPLLLASAAGLRARLAAATLASLPGGPIDAAVLSGGLQAVRAAGARLVDDEPDSAMASRDSPGRIPAAVWKMPLEKTRPLMLRYLAWEEALASRVR